MHSLAPAGGPPPQRESLRAASQGHPGNGVSHKAGGAGRTIRRGCFQADNIQAPFLKLSIAKQRDLNGDGRETIAGCGPALPHSPYNHSLSLFLSLSLSLPRCRALVCYVAYFFLLFLFSFPSLSLRYRAHFPFLPVPSLESFLPISQFPLPWRTATAD